MNTIVQTLAEKRKYVKGKIIIGIDPAKDKYQIRILDPNRIPIGKTFSFKNDYNGFNKFLWQKLDQHLDREVDYREEVVFAIETACDLWQPLVHYLYSNGYLVVRVSPLSTYHSRVQIGNDFSKTDPKDALVIASNASNGNFVLHNEDDAAIIKKNSKELGHVPIIDSNARGGKKIPFDPAKKVRYRERSSVERVFGRLKDEYGGRMIRVQGASKVMAHLLFGIIPLTIDQLARFVE